MRDATGCVPRVNASNENFKSEDSSFLCSLSALVTSFHLLGFRTIASFLLRSSFLSRLLLSIPQARALDVAFGAASLSSTSPVNAGRDYTCRHTCHLPILILIFAIYQLFLCSTIYLNYFTSSSSAISLGELVHCVAIPLNLVSIFRLVFIFLPSPFSFSDSSRWIIPGVMAQIHGNTPPYCKLSGTISIHQDDPNVSDSENEGRSSV